MISINMQKALAIKQNYIREERKGYLENLDVLYMRALESGDDLQVSNIKNRKQALRDCTQDSGLLNAKNPEDLKMFVPKAILNEIN